MITLLLLVRATYMYGVVLHAHPIRGESHNQRNTTERLQQYLVQPSCVTSNYHKLYKACVLCLNILEKCIQLTAAMGNFPGFYSIHIRSATSL